MEAKAMVIAGCLVAALTGASAADEACVARMTEVLSKALDVEPTRAMITSEIGGQVSENEMLMLSADHYMFKPVGDSGGMAWTLTQAGTMYQSLDQGASWTPLNSFDPEETRRQQDAMIAGQIATIENAVCGTEEIDGRLLETVEADMRNEEGFVFDIHSKYWIEPESRFVVKAETLMTAENFENRTTQSWTRAPDLVLPMVTMP